MDFVCCFLEVHHVLKKKKLCLVSSAMMILHIYLSLAKMCVPCIIGGLLFADSVKIFLHSGSRFGYQTNKGVLG